jgi:transcription-repair coupling factor (superfamily II helicase)
VHLELDIAAHIPKSYIAAERTRIEIYRRLVACRTPADVDQLDQDLRDAFGKYPPAVKRLLELAEIRVLAVQWRIKSIVLDGPDIVFSIEDLKLVQDLFADRPGTVRMPDPQTVHWRLPPSYHEPPTLMATLRQLLNPGAMLALA